MTDAVVVHEAGHAVVALRCGLEVARASAAATDPGVSTILPSGVRPGHHAVLRFAGRLIVDLSGATAEARAFGVVDVEAARPDEWNAHWRAAQLLRLARGIGDRPLDAEERAVCESLVAIFRRTAEKLVAENWPAIEVVADALADRPLSGAEIEALIMNAS